MEIRPVPSRFRQMLSLPPDNEDETIIIGAHIVRPIDPLPHFQAHQASCEGERAKLKKLIFFLSIYMNFCIVELPIRMRAKNVTREPVVKGR